MDAARPMAPRARAGEASSASLIQTRRGPLLVEITPALRRAVQEVPAAAVVDTTVRDRVDRLFAAAERAFDWYHGRPGAASARAESDGLIHLSVHLPLHVDDLRCFPVTFRFRDDEEARTTVTIGLREELSAPD